MKKKLIVTLSILFMFGFLCSESFAAEVLDVPHNTETEVLDIGDKQKNTVDEEKTKEELSSDIVDNEIVEAKKTKKRLFSRAEKSKKGNEQNIEQQDPSNDILVDSETVEYFPDRHEFEAYGNARVAFPRENSALYADKIVYNHDTNFVKGYGNVVLVQKGQRVNGDFIQVDLNEANALIDNPVLNNALIKISAKSAILCDNKTEAMDGKVTFNEKVQYKMWSRPIMGFQNPLMEEVMPEHLYFKEKYDNKWRLKAKTIIIDSKKDRDVATLKNADLYIQNTKMSSAGKLRLFTDKSQQYVETNRLEFGSLRNFGAFVSPGYVFQTPNASTLKIGPALTYKSGLGVGALGRFQTDLNKTDFGYSSSVDRFVIRGQQEYTDNLKLQYGLNSYMNNWFLGGRMPEYGAQLIHQKSYNIKDLDVNFQNRFSGGFMKDWKRDFSTTRASWMTQTSKPLFTYKNTDSEFAASFGVQVQTSASIYGTGDTMGVVRAGPYLRTQYKSWQQYLAYFQGGIAGETPFRFDRYYYGRSSIRLGESIRLSKYLTLMYAGTIVLSDDTPNDRMFQESRIYFAVGPDDMKFLIGYDTYRQNATMGLIMNVGADNSEVQFNRLILNDPQAIGKYEKKEKEIIKAREQEKMKEESSVNRPLRDYDNYNTDYRMMPGASMFQPSMMRPMGI